MTPFLLNLSCVWERAAGVAFGPWDFSPGDGVLRFHGVEVEPLGWKDMETMAGDDADAQAWLATFRRDVTDHLAIRERYGDRADHRPRRRGRITWEAGPTPALVSLGVPLSRWCPA